MSPPRLVVVYGEANTGKIARAWHIASMDSSLRFLHRDNVRVLFGRLISEAHLTHLLMDMAQCMLSQGYGVITIGQNLWLSDTDWWDEVAKDVGATIEWVDSATPWEGSGK